MSWSKERSKREAVNLGLGVALMGAVAFFGFNFSTYLSARNVIESTAASPETQTRIDTADAVADGSIALIETDLILIAACSAGLYANNRGRDSQATDTTYNPKLGSSS